MPSPELPAIFEADREGSGGVCHFLCKPAIGMSIVAGVALIARFAYLAQARLAPDFEVLFSDQTSYDRWAQQIAAGDWLSRAQGVFFQSPLYPYFLSIFYAIFGHEVFAVRVVQLLLSSIACVMIYAATRRLLGVWPALAAGVLLALYPSSILLDSQIDKTALDTFLLATLILLAARFQPNASAGEPILPKARAWLWIGLVLGLWALNRENALLLLPILAAWTWFGLRSLSPRDRFVRITFLFVGTIGLLSISGFRNLVVGGEWHLTTAQFGHNFWLGNGDGADGVYRTLQRTHGDPAFERQDTIDIAQRAVGRTLSPGEISNYFARRTLDEIRASPSRWIWLMGRKLLLVWNRAEIADSTDLDYFVAWSSVLRWLDAVLSFPVLLAMFAFGIAATWPSRRRLAVLYALIVAFAISVAGFYVFSRYRYPLVLMLAPVAGGGLAQIVPMIRARQWRTLTIGTVLAAGALAISLPSGIVPIRIRGTDYYNRAVAYENRGDLDSALSNYERSLRANPDAAQTHSNLGLLYAKQNNFPSAIDELDSAARLGPSQWEYFNNRATVLIRAERFDEAQRDLSEAVRLNPESISAWFNLGLLAGQRGELELSIKALSEVVHRQANYPNAEFRLGQMLATAKRDAEAVSHLRRALQVDPDSLHAADMLAQLLATSGDPSVKNPIEAQRIAETASNIAGEQSPALLDTLAVTLAEQGKFDEAIAVETRAKRLAEESGQSRLAEQIGKRLQRFADRKNTR